MAIWYYIWQILRNLVPIIFLIALVILSIIPKKLPHYPEIAPMLTIVGIEYLTIVRYRTIQSSVAFGVGLIEDILTGTPFGSSAITLLCAQMILLSQKKFFYSRPFSVAWFSFSIVALLLLILKYGLFLIYTQNKICLTNLAFSYTITILIYPAFKRLLLITETNITRKR